MLSKRDMVEERRMAIENMTGAWPGKMNTM